MPTANGATGVKVAEQRRLTVMRLHRHTTRCLSGALLLLLVFMQLATAAYACPAAVGAAGAMTVVEMPGCDGDMSRDMDLDQPQLCKAHCQQGNQAVGAAPAGDLVSWPVLHSVLDWRLDALLPEGPERRPVDLPPGATPPGSPPIYLSLLVLRN